MNLEDSDLKTLAGLHTKHFREKADSLPMESTKDYIKKLKEILDELPLENIEKIDGRPIALLLTHGHFDHTLRVGKIKRYFKCPLMYSKNEYDSGIYNLKKADRWLKEGDIIKIGDISLNVLETPGHSPGSLSYYSKEIKNYKNNNIDGIIFTGDLLFRRSIGRSDIEGGNQNILFSSKRGVRENS